MVLPFDRIGRSCCTRKKAPDIDGEEFVKVFDRRFLDGRCFRDPCIRDKDVEAIAHDGADLLGEPVWTVRCGEISRDSIGAAAGLADLSDDGFRFLRAASVMDGTWPPALASANALARPMPREAPVTRAVFPESAGMGLSRSDIEARGRLCLGRPSKIPVAETIDGNGSRSDGLRFALPSCSADARNWSASDTKSSGYW